MTKTLILVLILLVVGFLIIWALMAFLKRAEQLEDEDYQEQVRVTRDLRQAADDFRYDQEQARRFDDLKKKGKK